MENYLGGSSKALQFAIDALKHARDKCLPDAPGQVERNKFRPTFLLHHAFNRSLDKQNYGKFGDSNLVAFRNISL
jgi:hypothetical protein